MMGPVLGNRGKKRRACFVVWMLSYYNAESPVSVPILCMRYFPLDDFYRRGLWRKVQVN